MDTIRKAFEANIARTGRQIVCVFDASPPFSYTIGNSLRGDPKLPELLVFGLFGEEAETVLNHLSKIMVDRRRTLDVGLVDLGGKLRPMAVNADPMVKVKYTIQAGQFFRNEDYRVMQIIIPDLVGRFPWDAGCSEPYRSAPIFRAQ